MISASSLYAAIDLGSNSFHMLVVRNVAGTIQTVARIKRKVRLAAGLDDALNLSREAMERGWQCLRLFSEQLQDIPAEQIRVVATATLRLATNADMFLTTAQALLGCPVNVISGEAEARLIYRGVAHTTSGSGKRLVVDIGGGSTELVAGDGSQAIQLFSLPMGCVTWLERYFGDRTVDKERFEHAEKAAHTVIQPITEALKKQGWQICVGASGTVQALQEIMVAQGMDEYITLDKLQQLKQRAIQCHKLEELEIEGLTLERALVFPSGLSILIAIFQALDIDCMTLAGGALREGLVYDMLQIPVEQNVRLRTLNNIQQRFAIDTEQAGRVCQRVENLIDQLASTPGWQLDDTCRALLISASLIHEIGLSISFKKAPQHAAYLIHHLDLPGFTPAQRKLLATLLQNQKNSIDLSLLSQQNAVPLQTAERMCRLLRLAIILTGRRHTDTEPAIHIQADNDQLQLTLSEGWLTAHPLRAALLEQESHWQSYVHWSLIIK